MKKTIYSVLIGLSLLASGCAKDSSQSRGIINKLNDEMSPDVKYELIVGNVIWGILLFETIAAPVYFFGFSLWEPKKL